MKAVLQSTESEEQTSVNGKCIRKFPDVLFPVFWSNELNLSALLAKSLFSCITSLWMATLINDLCIGVNSDAPIRFVSVGLNYRLDACMCCTVWSLLICSEIWWNKTVITFCSLGFNVISEIGVSLLSVLFGAMYWFTFAISVSPCSSSEKSLPWRTAGMLARPTKWTV